MADNNDALAQSVANLYPDANPVNLPSISETPQQSVSNIPLFNNDMLARLGINPASLQGGGMSTAAPASFMPSSSSADLAASKTPTSSKVPVSVSSDDSSEDDDSDEEEEESPSAIAISKANPAPGNSQIYSSDSNEDALKAAQASQQDILNRAMFARSAQQLAAGFAGAGYTPNYGVAEQLEKNSGIPVQNVMDLRKAQDQDITRQANILTLQNQQALNDPNSDISKQARDFVQNRLGIKTTGNESLQQLNSILPMYEKEQLAKQHSDDLRFKIAQLAATKELALSSKASDAQNRAALQTDQLLETIKGNKAVGQAENDIYNAQKANTLVNMYGDPNKLAMPQVRLLASEVNKIASGGVSTQAELEGITPHTLAGKLSEITSTFTNHPTAANAAAFVKQYQDYANGLTKDAQKVIEDKYGRVLTSRRAEMGESNYQIRKAQYIDRFNNTTQQQPTAPHGGKYPIGSVVNVKGQNYKVGADGDTLEPL